MKNGSASIVEVLIEAAVYSLTDLGVSRPAKTAKGSISPPIERSDGHGLEAQQFGRTREQRAARRCGKLESVRFTFSCSTQECRPHSSSGVMDGPVFVPRAEFSVFTQ